MILDEDKIIFVHIPNNGGTTIGNIVHPKLQIKNTGRTYGHIINDSTQHYAEHSTYYEYKNSIIDNINKYFVFTFVRNPYSRIFSKWRQGCKEYKSGINKHWGYSGHTELNKCFFDNQSKILFKKFINCLYEERVIVNIIGGSQLHFIGNNTKNMNYIGRFENFESDAKTLINLLNNWVDKLKFSHKIMHLNQKSKYKDEYKNYYDKKTQKQIQQILFDEFFKLNYDYDIL